MTYVPKLNFQRQSPATFDSCNICNIVGMKVGKYPVYPGSISYVTDPALRARYKRDMPQAWRHLADSNPPVEQTDASIRYQHAHLDNKNAMYKRRDPFLELPLWRTHKYHINDPSHLLANIIELVWSHLVNSGKHKYRSQHHDLEWRFRDMDVKYPYWSFNPNDLKMVTHYINDWSYFDKRIPNPVTHISALKFSHWFALASNLGIFIIEQSTLRRQYKMLFLDLMNLVRLALLRSVTIDVIRQADLQIHSVLARMELTLPFRVNSIVKHHLHHLFSTVECYWM